MKDTLALFAASHRIGAIAVLHLNCFVDGRKVPMLQPPPSDGRAYVVPSFIGTAYAVRRDVFLKLGGFQDDLFHWGEEGEYALRLLGAGYVIRVGESYRIHHWPEGVAKYTHRTTRYIPRNGILTAWLNAPARYLPSLIGRTTLFALWNGVRGSWGPWTVLQGLGMGFWGIVRLWNKRKPLTVDQFQLWSLIRRNSPLPLADVLPHLGGNAED